MRTQHNTDRILSDADDVSLTELKKDIRKRDKKRLIERCTEKVPLLVEVNKRGRY